MKNNVFIIGSNSFSAGSFINLLLKKKYNVYGVSRSDINNKCFLNFNKDHNNFTFYKLNINTNQKKIINLIKKHKPKYIVNYASQSMVAESWQNSKDWFYTNSYSIPILYKKIYDLNIIKQLVHISTPEVYGTSLKKITENINYNPSTPYAISRTTADMYLKILHEFNSCPCVSIRAANVYGEHQRLYRIIPKTIGFFLKNKVLNLHGRGETLRSFIHIHDVSLATYLVMKKGLDGSIYHVSNNKQISIKSLVRKIANKLKIDFNLYTNMSEDRLGKDIAYKLDSSKIRKLGWKPKISLDEGIDRVIKWYKNYSDDFKKSDFSYKHKK